MLDDDEYAAALVEELEGLKKKLTTSRQVRDEGRVVIRQLRTEQRVLKKQKEQREKYRDLTVQKKQVEKQLEDKKQQKKAVLQQIVDLKRKLNDDAKSEGNATNLDSTQEVEGDISEITYQNEVEDNRRNGDEARCQSLVRKY